MIEKMKKFENPMLQIVGINKSDIITTSTTLNVNSTATSTWGDAPGMRGLFDPDDSWANAGY